ncbi:MAG: EAL domain-containing protein, partial [Marinomonas sp.]
FGYAGIVGVFVAGLIVPIFAPIYLELSAAGLFLVTFAGLRGFNRWRGSIEMRSGESGLPTLKALTRKLQTIKTLEHQSLVAAKLHGLSDAMAMLDDDGRLKYFEAIAARLKIANSDLELFANSGEHIVWHEGFEQRDILQSHLVALKAIFANPLEIGGKFFDVPVTFAADLSFGEAAATRISNVIALADKTSLAEVPILIGDEATSKDREWTVSLQSSIDAALKKGEIFPVFQPKVCLDDGSICGYEALVRWNDKERGFISPAYFIEQCEQAGRMGKLTQFMLEQSIRQYQASAAYPNGGTLAVNISSTMFSDTSLPQMVSDILDATGFPEERLVIEVTETARIHDPKTAKSVLNALASIGVGLSLDDFGTGTAGLETLYNYPFSEIKIDRAFIAGLNSDPKARLICNQVIELGNSLNMNVVAEGIEDLATMMALKQMGCPMMQGFYLGRPEVEPAIEPLVRLDLTGN